MKYIVVETTIRKIVIESSVGCGDAIDSAMGFENEYKWDQPIVSYTVASADQ